MSTANETFELAGMPGAGKSTLHTEVVRRLAEVGIGLPGVSPPDAAEAEDHFRVSDARFWRRSRCCITEVAKVRHAAGHGSMEEMLKRVAGLWFGRAYSVHTALARGDGQPTLLEEGTLHELWRMTYFLRGLRRERSVIRDLWPGLPRCSTIIWLSVDADTRRERIREKRHLGPINRDLLAQTPESRDWVDAEEAYRRLVRRSARRGARCIAVDNTRSVECAAEYIARLVAPNR